MGGKFSKWGKTDATNNASAKVRRGKSDVGRSQPRKSPQKVNKSADQPGTPVENENATVTLNTADLLQAASNSNALKDVIHNLKEEETKASDLVKEETNKIIENTSTAINDIKESENVQKIKEFVHEGAEKVESVVENAVSKVNEITGGTVEVTVDKSSEKVDSVHEITLPKENEITDVTKEVTADQSIETETAPKIAEISSDVQMSMVKTEDTTTVIKEEVIEEKDGAPVELKKEEMELAENDKSGISINLPSVDSGLSTFKSSAMSAVESFSTSAENAKTTAEQFVNETLEETKTSAMNMANNIVESVPFLEKGEEKTAENIPESQNEMDKVSDEIEKTVDTEVKSKPEVEEFETENKNEGQFSMPTIDDNFIQENLQSLTEKGNEIIESGGEKLNSVITDAENAINDTAVQLIGTTVFSTEMDKVNEDKSEPAIEDHPTGLDSKPDEGKIEDNLNLVSSTEMRPTEENHEVKEEEQKPDMDAIVDQKEPEQHDTTELVETVGTISKEQSEISQHVDEIKMDEVKDIINDEAKPEMTEQIKSETSEDVKSDCIGESKSDHVDEMNLEQVETSITTSEEVAPSQPIADLKTESVDEVELNKADENNASNESEQHNEIVSEHKETESESFDISDKENISHNLNTENVDTNQSTEDVIPTEVLNEKVNVNELPDSNVDEKASEIVDTTIEQAKAEVEESFESNELPAPPEPKPASEEDNVLERQQSDTVIENMDDKRTSELSLPDPPIMTNTILSNGLEGSENCHTPEINKSNDELLNKIVDSETTIKVCPKADLEEKLTKYLKTKNLVEDSVEANRLISQFLDTLDISDLEASVNRCTTKLFEEIKHGEITEDSRNDLVSLLLKTSS